MLDTPKPLTMDDLDAAIERIKRNDPLQDCFVMHSKQYGMIKSMLERWRRRETKALRKGLSARYGQRRRQKAQGVALIRHQRREAARQYLLNEVAI